MLLEIYNSLVSIFLSNREMPNKVLRLVVN